MVVGPNDVRMDTRGLERVEDLFNRQIEEGHHPGAALAVYRFGKLVLDLHGGLADVAAGTPVTEETMFVLYSSTKSLTASCLHLLWERGQCEPFRGGPRQGRQPWKTSAIQGPLAE